MLTAESNSLDLQRLFQGILADLEGRGASATLPIAQKYCPDRIKDAEKLLEIYDALFIKHRSGEIPAYAPEIETPAGFFPRIPTPAVALLDWWSCWWWIIKDIEPIMERRAA